MKPRILVIEDNPTNTELVTYLIAAAGWEALVAADGEDGLAQTRKERPDLVLCDIQLPKLDGFGVVAGLKADPELRVIPVIAITALAMVGDRERAIAAGFDGYLPKPIVPETFLEALHSFLPNAVSGIRAHTIPSTPPIHEERSSALPGSILIVDDRPDNIALCRSILEPLVGEIRIAASVTEALRAIGERLPDLVISDMLMPGRGGLDLLDILRADPAHGAVRFVAISSVPHQEYGVLLRGRAVHPDAVLFRPLEPAALRAAIMNILAQLKPKGVQP